jgi:pyruvate formate lyase activating enzyme
VEVTTLVVPGVNDTPEEMDELATWLASVDAGIVLHVTRFFPRWRMRDRGPTPVQTEYALADVARAHLPQVFTGNC